MLVEGFSFAVSEYVFALDSFLTTNLKPSKALASKRVYIGLHLPVYCGSGNVQVVSDFVRPQVFFWR